jgi:hypothetical protein
VWVVDLILKNLSARFVFHLFVIKNPTWHFKCGLWIYMSHLWYLALTTASIFVRDIKKSEQEPRARVPTYMVCSWQTYQCAVWYFILPGWGFVRIESSLFISLCVFSMSMCRLIFLFALPGWGFVQIEPALFISFWAYFPFFILFFKRPDWCRYIWCALRAGGIGPLTLPPIGSKPPDKWQPTHNYSVRGSRLVAGRIERQKSECTAVCQWKCRWRALLYTKCNVYQHHLTC